MRLARPTDNVATKIREVFFASTRLRQACASTTRTTTPPRTRSATPLTSTSSGESSILNARSSASIGAFDLAKGNNEWSSCLAQDHAAFVARCRSSPGQRGAAMWLNQQPSNICVRARRCAARGFVAPAAMLPRILNPAPSRDECRPFVRGCELALAASPLGLREDCSRALAFRGGAARWSALDPSFRPALLRSRRRAAFAVISRGVFSSVT